MAAGLGTFGRHNLVIHPELGTRIVFTALLTDLDLDSDPQDEEDHCIHCGLCVKHCPASALDEEGKTHVGRCLPKSQPEGIGGAIRFGMKLIDADPAEKKAMLADPAFWRLYQASFIGFQYHCFQCMARCPVGQK